MEEEKTQKVKNKGVLFIASLAFLKGEPIENRFPLKWENDKDSVLGAQWQKANIICFKNSPNGNQARQ